MVFGGFVYVCVQQRNIKNACSNAPRLLKRQKQNENEKVKENQENRIVGAID